MPEPVRIPHMATIIAAANVICRVLDKYYSRVVIYLDTPEATALLALKIACEQFKATLPISD